MAQSAIPSLKLESHERFASIATAVVFALLLLFGGGGAPAPLAQSVLQALGFMALLGLAWTHWFVRPLGNELRRGGVFIALMVLIPVLQLIPLPYGLWRALPGHRLANEILVAAGQAGSARPISLDPEATRFAALSMLPPTAVFLAAARQGLSGRLLMIRVAIAMAAVSALIAAMQVALPGNRFLYLFPKSSIGSSTGLFANRNFQSDLMLIGILLCAGLQRVTQGRIRLKVKERHMELAATTLLVPLFALMTLATHSRTGAVLLPLVLFFAYIIAFGRQRMGRLVVAAGSILLAGAVVLVALPRFSGGLLTRFDVTGDERTTFVPDILLAIRTYFPLGSGLGTFDPVYRGVESLSLVEARYLNHAHDDYLEILMETGIAGGLLVATFLYLVIVRFIRFARLTTGADGALARTGAAIIALLMVHSVGDYPLRTITLVSIFGLASALLFTVGHGLGEAKRSRIRAANPVEAGR